MRPIYFFWIVFVISLYWIGYLYQDFLMNLLIAGLLCVATFWLKDFFDRYIKWNALSSFFCVFLLLTFLIVPFYFVGYKIIGFVLDMNMEAFSSFIDKIKQLIAQGFEYFPAWSNNVNNILSSISAESIMTYAIKFSGYIGKHSLNFVIDAAFIVIFLFFFFYYAHKFYDYILRLLPFEVSQSQEVFQEINGVLRVVFLTSILNVFLQGFMFGLMIIWFDYDGFLFGVLFGLASLIPVVGGALVWIPIVAYELYLGNIGIAIFIIIYSLVFIGFVIDNLIKPIIIGIIKQKILKTPLQINEILIFFSILAGISSFGFWGIVVGPTITAFFIALLRLYENNFSSKSDLNLVKKF
ncbi:AI-2E family transporter [Helicobacter sp. 13S00477-4]|uniref:AI-2E family transporter n=1 Tax=Helicobacter sp. 13S00477-4 TaxID=1905759 RepID=UPI000BA5E39B|nr:AI-2E family transporter [Helicobacter sp. 13S00477-4]PAF51630.1 AI-2E family transporter [Helicobacter sp. 13S00477-4]